MKIDITQISDIDWDGVDYYDYPDYCDAFIISATYKGREMKSDEIDMLMDEYPGFCYDELWASLH